MRKIADAVDAVLCLLPFEKDFYDRHVPGHALLARFVGHPLADRIPMEMDQGAAREALGLRRDLPCIALLPGSRLGEVRRHAADFAATVVWLHAQRPALQFVAAMANSATNEIFIAALAAAGVADRVRLVDGRSQDVVAASDAVLLASGTATLEVTLIKRPMVVVYRADWLTSFLFRVLGLMKAPFFALPNLLAGRKIVPEYLNDDVRAETLGPVLLEQLDRPDRDALIATFADIHLRLRCDASRQAVLAIQELMGPRK